MSAGLRGAMPRAAAAHASGTAADTIEIGLVSLDVSDAARARFAAWLSDEEHARAVAFRHALLRDRFVARRGRLREFLARLHGVAPIDVQPIPGDDGRPAWRAVGAETVTAGRDGAQESDAPRASGGLRGGRGSAASCGHVSVSHSGGAAIFAWSAARVVGIDLELHTEVELRQPDPDVVEVAARVLHPAERAALAAVPAAHRARAFLAAWTLKEAHLKALGSGLRIDPAGIDSAAAVGAGGAWSAHALPVGPAGVATLVCARRDRPLLLRFRRNLAGATPTP
jgi:4'-phosphopantetheinyl transferase